MCCGIFLHERASGRGLWGWGSWRVKRIWAVLRCELRMCRGMGHQVSRLQEAAAVYQPLGLNIFLTSIFIACLSRSEIAQLERFQSLLDEAVFAVELLEAEEGGAEQVGRTWLPSRRVLLPG